MLRDPAKSGSYGRLLRRIPVEGQNKSVAQCAAQGPRTMARRCMLFTRGPSNEDAHRAPTAADSAASQDSGKPPETSYSWIARQLGSLEYTHVLVI